MIFIELPFSSQPGIPLFGGAGAGSGVAGAGAGVVAGGGSGVVAGAAGAGSCCCDTVLSGALVLFVAVDGLLVCLVSGSFVGPGLSLGVAVALGVDVGVGVLLGFTVGFTVALVVGWCRLRFHINLFNLLHRPLRHLV
jgi:hypothetical protein